MVLNTLDCSNQYKPDKSSAVWHAWLNTPFAPAWFGNNQSSSLMCAFFWQLEQEVFIALQSKSPWTLHLFIQIVLNAAYHNDAIFWNKSLVLRVGFAAKPLEQMYTIKSSHFWNKKILWPSFPLPQSWYTTGLCWIFFKFIINKLYNKFIKKVSITKK